MKIYVDPLKIRKTGNYAVLTTLGSFNSLNKGSLLGISEPYWSEIINYEFDCPNQKYRLLSTLRFSGPMASGKIVESETSPTEWSNVRGFWDNTMSLVGVGSFRTAYYDGACRSH